MANAIVSSALTRELQLNVHVGPAAVKAFSVGVSTVFPTSVHLVATNVGNNITGIVRAAWHFCKNNRDS